MAFFRDPAFGPGWSAADPNQAFFTSRFPDRELISSSVGIGDRGGVTTVSFPLTEQQMEPVRLNTNLLLREPFAVAMDDMDDHYMIYIYQPNMRKKDISMTLLGDVLTIHGSRHLRGVSYELSRELALPSDADVSQLQAEFTSGRIDVKIPKISSRRAYRSIPIGGIQPTPTSTPMDTEAKQEQAVPKPTPSPRRNIPISGVTTQETEEQSIRSTTQEQVKETTPTSRSGSIPIAVSGQPTQDKTAEAASTPAPAPAPAPSPSPSPPRRNIPIGELTSPATPTAPQAKQTPISMETDSHKMIQMPPPSPRQRTHPTLSMTPESQHEPKPSIVKSHDVQETKQATPTETQHKSKQPTSPDTQATRECEPFPGVDVGGIPEPADTDTTSEPSTTTEFPSPALESDVSMTGHDVSVAKTLAEEEKRSHELEHDVKQHHPHVHHPTQQSQQVTQIKHIEPLQATESKQQPEKVTERKQDEETQAKQPSIISRVADVAKKATHVVMGTGAEPEQSTTKPS